MNDSSPKPNNNNNQPQQPTYIVQQVQTTKNLKGLSGWLMFFLICFALAALSMLSVSIFCIFVPVNTATTIITAVFTPFIAACALLSVAFIALQFKIARIFSIATYAAAAIYSATITLVAVSETKILSNIGAIWAGAIVGIIASLIIYGLLALYFIVSKRVKETLVKDLPKVTGIAVFSAVGGVALILAVLGVIFSATSKNNIDLSDLSDDYDYSYDYDFNDDDETTEQPDPETKTIGKTITDPELGYEITVKQAIFNVPFDDDYYADDYKSVAVEVSVANNSSYYNSFSSYDLAVIINGESQSSYNSEFKGYIDDNSLTVLPSSTTRGSSSTGWIFFSYDKDLTGDIEFTYDRDEHSTTDGKTIPAKKFSITLNQQSATT